MQKLSFSVARFIFIYLFLDVASRRRVGGSSENECAIHQLLDVVMETRSDFRDRTPIPCFAQNWNQSPKMVRCGLSGVLLLSVLLILMGPRPSMTFKTKALHGKHLRVYAREVKRKT